MLILIIKLLIYILKNSNIILINLFSNTAVILLHSKNLCYDHKNPNANYNLQLRIANNLPSKPKIYSINIFDILNQSNLEHKI